MTSIPTSNIMLKRVLLIGQISALDSLRGVTITNNFSLGKFD